MARINAAKALLEEAAMAEGMYTQWKVHAGFTRLSALKDGVLTALAASFPPAAAVTRTLEARAEMVEACVQASLAQMRLWAMEIEAGGERGTGPVELERIARQSEALKMGIWDISDPEGDVNSGTKLMLEVLRSQRSPYGFW